jgi:RimJ/RimL family protein N-acetyltransferase
MTYELPPPPKLGGEPLELVPSKALVRAVLDIALEDPAYLRYSNLPSGVKSEALADHRQQKVEAGEAAYWALLPVSRQIAGIVELWFRDENAGVLEAGYWVAEPQRRKGFGSAALCLVTDWVRDETTAERIELAIHPDNDPSLKLAEGAGYCHRGTCTSSAPGSPRDEFYELYIWERQSE